LLCVALLPGGGLAAIHGNLPGILLAGLGSVCLGAFTAYLLLGKSPGKALDALEQAMRFLAQNDGKSRFEPLDAFHGSLKPISDALEELRIRCRDNYERLHGLLDGIHLPFLLVDTQERVQFTNELLLSMLEIDGGKEKQYRRTLSEVFYNDPSRKTMVGRAMNNRENVPARGGHTRP
jgi:methyl-accepting chemotaxis protein